MQFTKATFMFLVGGASFIHGFTVPSTPVNANANANSNLQKVRSSTSSTSLHVIDAQMENRLDGIRRSYLTLTERLGDPDVLGDANLLRKVMSDRSQSEEVVETYDEYSRLKEELAGAKELFQEAGDDADLREMAREEIKSIEPQMEELEDKIKILLLPRDPNDDRNVMLELRAGTGGSEANLFVGELYDVYRKYITANGWRATMIDSSVGDDGGYKSVMLDVQGDMVYSRLKWEAGRCQKIWIFLQTLFLHFSLFLIKKYNIYLYLYFHSTNNNHTHTLKTKQTSRCSPCTKSSRHRIARPCTHIHSHCSRHARGK